MELGPLIDPEVHSCGTVPPHGAKLLAHPDKDFYIVGMKSYGRAPTFLLAAGYEQVRSVAAPSPVTRSPPTPCTLSFPRPGSAPPTPAPAATSQSPHPQQRKPYLQNPAAAPHQNPCWWASPQALPAAVPAPTTPKAVNEPLSGELS